MNGEINDYLRTKFTYKWTHVVILISYECIIAKIKEKYFMVISSQETFICKTLNVIVIVYYFEIQKIKALKIQFIINFELINDVKRYILKCYFPLPKF